MTTIDSLPADLFTLVLNALGHGPTFALAPRVCHSWNERSKALLASLTELDTTWRRHIEATMTSNPHQDAHGVVAMIPENIDPHGPAMHANAMLDFSNNLRRFLRACPSLQRLTIDAEVLVPDTSEFAIEGVCIHPPPLPAGVIRCPDLRFLTVKGTIDTTSTVITDLAEHHPLLEELNWSYADEYCDIGWEFRLPALAMLMERCPNLRQVPILWVQPTTYYDGLNHVQHIRNEAAFTNLVRRLRAYGCGSLKVVRIHTMMDSHSEIMPLLQELARMPGNFTGVVELHTCTEGMGDTDSDDDNGDERDRDQDKWIGEHVRVLTKKISF